MSMAIKLARGRPNRGDPGLGSFLKKATGFVSKLGIPLVSGVAGAISGVLPGSRAATPVALPTMTGGFAPTTSGPGQSPPLQVGPLRINLPGFGPPGMGVTAFGGADPAMMNGRPAGHRLNKSGYFLRSGEFVPPGTRWVKIRRRNSLNPRALDRAMGRLTSAKRAATKLSRISIRPAKSCR